MRLVYCLFATFLAGSSMLFAQQEAQFTQYNDNQLYYNPAYAGSHDMMNVTVLHRSQWVGIKGAPSTQSILLHTPLPKNLGLGITVLNDKIGPMNHTWLMGDLSYSLKLNEAGDSRLAFGIKGGINRISASLQDLNMNDIGDPNAINYSGRTMVNFGAGAYYHSKRFYFGASIPMIMNHGNDVTFSFYDRQRHFYVSTGGYFSVNRTLKLRPSAMLRVVPNAPFSLDGSLALIFYDQIWIAGTYRLMESAGVYFQFQITNQLKVGYGYDLSVNKLRRHNMGTHELLLSIDLNSQNYKENKTLSPRFF